MGGRDDSVGSHKNNDVSDCAISQSADRSCDRAGVAIGTKDRSRLVLTGRETVLQSEQMHIGELGESVKVYEHNHQRAT